MSLVFHYNISLYQSRFINARSSLRQHDRYYGGVVILLKGYVNLKVYYQDTQTTQTLINRTGPCVCEQGLYALPPFRDVQPITHGEGNLLYNIVQPITHGAGDPAIQCCKTHHS